jgi:tetratricopeptide (TPR) repeat protein
VAEFETAQRFNPFDLSWIPWLKGMAHFTARQYDAAIANLERVEVPIAEVHGWLAASYAQVGRLDDARAALEAFLRENERSMAVFPGRRLRDWETYWHAAVEYRDQAEFDHLFAALRKAGYPE